jgi:cyclic pyranopterin monophosphate synthase
MAGDLTHLDHSGRARMVDVGAKPVTAREASATGRVRMAAETLKKALSGDSKKGSVRAVAEIAGIMAAKRTAELIPLCHPVALTSVLVEIEADEAALVVTARAKTSGQTGVEMEALTAVSVACLTIYDMLKASDRAMVIEGITLLEKSGGASGDYRAAR